MSLLQKIKESNYAVPGAIFAAYIVLHIVFQRHERMAYDMYTYTSFAQHYAENWFYTVIPGQAHGLEIVSYPPLLFQIMALMTFIPFLDQNLIAMIFVSAAVPALSYSLYIFSRELTGKDVNRNLFIVLIAFSPGLMKFALVHGQLPFLAGMSFGFAASASYLKMLDGENTASYLSAFLLLTAFIHHFSFLITSIIFVVLTLMNFREFLSSIDIIVPTFLVSGTVSLAGLYPMIRETLFGISQGVIEHGSRTPLESASTFHHFVTTTYGVTILGLALIFRRDDGRYHGLNVLMLVFMTIGLGFLTPTPEIIFGSMANFIVYDRFSLVSSLFLTGLIVYFLSGLRTRVAGINLSTVLATVFILLSVAVLFWSNLLHLNSVVGYGYSEPDQTQQTIDFLNTNASDDYLYLTNNHGPPVDEIRYRTDVPTLDTGYYQGRKLGILHDTGKFDRMGHDEFEQIQQRADNLSLKYVFLYEDRFNSWFHREEGWTRTDLGEDVTVWVNSDVPKYEPDRGERRILFTFMPMAVLLFSTLVFASREFSGAISEKIEDLGDRFREFPGGRKLRALLIFLFPVVAAAPSFLTSGYPSGIDTPAHIFKPQLMQHMVESYGQTFRWTNQWYNGYPFMAMYPPVSTHLLYYLDSLMNNITLAYNAVRFGVLLATSAVFYRLSEQVTSDKRLRLAAAALSVFSFPLYSNLYTVGRLASAVSVPLYLFLIHIALREDIFQKEVSRGHLYLGISAGLLFLTHSMMAYLFIYTGLIFCIVYRRKIPEIGFKPILAALSVSLLSASAYAVRLVQHISVNETYWYVASVDFSIAGHVQRAFSIIPPSFMGWIPCSLFLIGILKNWREGDRFFRFSLFNFAFFYMAFWARNFNSAFFLPLSGQFDLSRFEVLYTVFALFIAVYGLKYLFENYLSDIDYSRKSIFLVLLVALAFLEVSPMLSQSANWEPEFQQEMDSIELDSDYRAIGVDMRHWHTYILWEMNVSNTFGWFGQANPNPSFTEALQLSGGRWYGGEFREKTGNDYYRKNLMELSNTKYVVSAEGEWMDRSRSIQVKGEGDLNHELNEELVASLRNDEEFRVIHDSEHLEILSFNRSMSYCEGVEPVWIQQDYRSELDRMLLETRMLPEIPVKGSPAGKREGAAEDAVCSRIDPYTVNISVSEPGWVLVKESKYPGWERTDGSQIFDASGFMVAYVEESADLRYKPRDITTLEESDLAALTDK